MSRLLLWVTLALTPISFQKAKVFAASYDEFADQYRMILTETVKVKKFIPHRNVNKFILMMLGEYSSRNDFESLYTKVDHEKNLKLLINDTTFSPAKIWEVREKVYKQGDAFSKFANIMMEVRIPLQLKASRVMEIADQSKPVEEWYQQFSYEHGASVLGKSDDKTLVVVTESKEKKCVPIAKVLKDVRIYYNFYAQKLFYVGQEVVRTGEDSVGTLTGIFKLPRRDTEPGYVKAQNAVAEVKYGSTYRYLPLEDISVLTYGASR